MSTRSRGHVNNLSSAGLLGRRKLLKHFTSLDRQDSGQHWTPPWIDEKVILGLNRYCSLLSFWLTSLSCERVFWNYFLVLSKQVQQLRFANTYNVAEHSHGHYSVNLSKYNCGICYCSAYYPHSRSFDRVGNLWPLMDGLVALFIPLFFLPKVYELFKTKTMNCHVCSGEWVAGTTRAIRAYDSFFLSTLISWTFESREPVQQLGRRDSINLTWLSPSTRVDQVVTSGRLICGNQLLSTV